MTKLYQLEIPKGYYVNDPNVKIGDDFLFYNTERLELVPYVGLLDYVTGTEYPRKGVPTRETMYAINIIKELIKQSIRNPLVFISKSRALDSFNKIFERTCKPFLVEKQSLCVTAFQVYLIIKTFLEEIGINKEIADKFAYYISHLLEFDDAYRYYLQDIVTVCDIYELQNNPRKEIKRLWTIFQYRELTVATSSKIEKLIKPILLLLLIPKYKKAFLKTVIYVKKISFDDADWYWARTKQNYMFGGYVSLNIKQPDLYINRNGVVEKLSTVNKS